MAISKIKNKNALLHLAIILFFIIFIVLFFNTKTSKNPQPITIRGKITENILGCFNNGACYLTIQTNDKNFEVIYNYGDYPVCPNKNLQYVNALTIGESVEIFGMPVASNKISVCNSNKFYIKKL
jgi:hypothetical protein